MAVLTLMAEVLVPMAQTRYGEWALVDEWGTTTWGQLNSRANQIIDALRGMGLQAGDVVACMCGNRREYFELFAAASHSGILVVPVNWHWVADEVAYALADSGSKIIFGDVRFAETMTAAIHDKPLLAAIAIGGEISGWTPWAEFVASGSDAEPDNQLVGGPMFYTSGTTGRPKGVRSSMLQTVMPASVLALVASGISQGMGLASDGVTFLNGPLYHSAQWAFSFLPMLGGAKVVMRDRFDPLETLAVMKAYKVTNIHLVPTQFNRLLKLSPAARARLQAEHLQVVWHGAAPCSPSVKRQMIEWWGPRISEYYGATEASIVSAATSEQWLAKPGTVGPVLPTSEVLIIDDDGNRVGPNVPGTIYVRSTMGQDFRYHGDDDKTAKAHLEPGVFTIGDVGYLDDEGWLFLSDRKIDMIISGGVNIYPAEIEGVLVSHPLVKDAAVFGIPNDDWGEEVKAAVELFDDVVASDKIVTSILLHCRSQLAGYKVPKSIDIEASLPRHPTGKLYKRLLRDRYWEGTSRAI